MAKDIFIVILIILLGTIVYYFFFRTTPTQFKDIKLGNQTYQLELAQTLSQKATGLMNRQSLCPNCGMLFIFSQETPQVFWMKNTLIPLDIIFLNKSGQIINIVTAPPEAKNPDGSYQTFASTAPAAYVIEINAGDSQKIGLSPGITVNLTNIP